MAGPRGRLTPKTTCNDSFLSYLAMEIIEPTYLLLKYIATLCDFVIPLIEMCSCDWFKLRHVVQANMGY